VTRTNVRVERGETTSVFVRRDAPLGLVVERPPRVSTDWKRNPVAGVGSQRLREGDAGGWREAADGEHGLRSLRSAVDRYREPAPMRVTGAPRHPEWTDAACVGGPRDW